MRYSLLILTLLTCACASKPGDPRDIYGISPDIQPYVDLYIEVKGHSLYYDIPIQFTTFTPPRIGGCIKWSTGHREIKIDKAYWFNPNTSESERISLIFHELGHCDLNREHDVSLRSDGWPTSLMYPYNVGYLSEDETYYFNELFNY